MRTIANIATMPGREQYLDRMVHSIVDQFDGINIYCNNFNTIPSCVRKYKNVSVIVGDDLTDNGKFYFVKWCEPGDIYFTVDDDIVYPRDYVKVTLANLQIHKGKIITYHGRILSGEGLPYYTGHKESFLFSGCIHKDTRIDVAGTGCTAFELTEEFFPDTLFKSPYKRMSDLVFSMEAALSEKEIIACKHDYGWLKSLKAPHGIASMYKDVHTPEQNQLADEIFNLIYNNV